MTKSKWTVRMMYLAQVISTWSKDSDHQVGAVIVDDRNRVLAHGYNGPPPGVIDDGMDRESETLRTLHAELNAILNARGSLRGSIMYIFPFGPCAQCSAAIIQKGIKRVIYFDDAFLGKWDRSQKEGILLLREAGVEIYNYSSHIDPSDEDPFPGQVKKVEHPGQGWRKPNEERVVFMTEEELEAYTKKL